MLPSRTRDPSPKPPRPCCPRPATASAATAGASSSWSTPTTTSSSSTCARATSRYTWAAERSTVGITGRDLLLDSEVEAEELLSLGFAASTFRFAAPVGAFSALEELEGKRIATSYDGLVRHYLGERGITASRVVRLDGAVESSVRLGVADAIADVVETGSTLKAAGMEVFGEPLLQSEAVLIGRTGHSLPAIDVLIRRLQGVLVARQYVLMDYDIRKDLVERAAALTPGLESPTVSPLRDSEWVAVRSMVPKRETNRIMDELYDLGARAILVSSIHACRI
ncbi:ATP phosphoribosyltransferase [Sinomonas cyclohexanicum]|uniref:ATP phosphoribosyltransferase n=1 Tax=Sinomonas cyclohexanicum TaxID=322009 RepID=A0ABN6FJ44_SINCY|nr:ATP phosphoribosyltransferase [Corynebacterium cyclohexanicum]